jgi:uncharacterized membrane-anchored protein YhcB (DUF1043 family)
MGGETKVMMWIAVIVGFIVGAVFGIILLCVLTGEKAAEEYKRGYEEGREAEYVSLMKAKDKFTKDGDDLCD